METAGSYSLLLAIHIFSFVVMALMLVLKVREVLRTGDGVKPIHLLLLVLVVALGAWLRNETSPHRFKVFYLGYENFNYARMIEEGNGFGACIAGTFEDCERIAPPVQGTGFSFLTAAAMKLGADETPETMFSLNTILGVASVVLMFLLVVAGTGNSGAALLAAFTLAVVPLGLVLSGNATADNANFVFLCVVFIFLILSMRKGSAMSVIGLVSAILFAILVEPMNAYVAVFVFIVLLVHSVMTRRKIVPAILGLIVVAAVFLALPSPYRDVFSASTSGFAEAMVTNTKILFRYYYTPLYLTIPVLVAPVFLGKRCGASRFLFFFPFFSVAVLSLFFQNVSVGDFPRLLFPAMAPMFLFVGVVGEWLLSLIPNNSVRNGVIALYLTLLTFSSVNASFLPLSNFGEAQDDYISANLDELSGDCIVLTANPSMGMVYTDNRTFELEAALNDDFIKTHPECKILVSDMACAGVLGPTCREIRSKYALDNIGDSEILKLYMVTIYKMVGRATEEAAPQPVEDTPVSEE